MQHQQLGLGAVLPPPCAIVVHAATWEDVGRIGIDTMPRRQAGQSA